MERLSMPLARDAIRQLTEAKGGCIRPVQLRRTDTVTGRSDVVLIPCGSTREDQCPACARRPVWHEASGRYLDPATGEYLPAWAEALDAIGPHDQPLHVAQFGPKFDAQGVIAGSKDAGRCIGYLTKYLTKQLGAVHADDGNAAAADHADRLVQALRCEPCSPGCANWLRYGINPRNPKAGMWPGHCRGKAHRRAYLGYAGRRVLVSRRWSGKTLTDHRADRKAWLLAMLDLPAPDTESGRYAWQRITPADPDHIPPAAALLHILTDRARQQAALTLARERARDPGNLPATRQEAA
jgi:hypothetical protein